MLTMFVFYYVVLWCSTFCYVVLCCSYVLLCFPIFVLCFAMNFYVVLCCSYVLLCFCYGEGFPSRRGGLGGGAAPPNSIENLVFVIL